MKKPFLACMIMVLVWVQEGEAQIQLMHDASVQVIEAEQELENPWAGGLNAGQYNRVDLDSDGVKDLVVYDRSSNLLYTYLLTGGEYIFRPGYRARLPENIEGWILFRDYDCDGRKDIFANTDRGMKAYRNITPQGGPLSWELVADPVLTLTNSGLINLQVNITDKPAIEDIDGDGDLDILVYNFAIGGFIRYHRNMSVEKTGGCGTLDYELVSRNWGYFEECDCNWYAFQEFGESCDDPPPWARVMHPGGKSLTLIDMDNDGDKDFLGGHEQCEELYYLENVGTPDDAKMTYWVDTFPSAEKPANFHIHPAAFYEDFDHDGVRDLVVAPNEQYNIDFRIDFGHSSWFYKNTGSNELPEFSFVTERFLQSSMIDLGDEAVPSLVDIDGDADLDLVIGANGKESNGRYYGYLRTYLNQGDALEPVFELAENDFLDFSEWQRVNLIPVFTDLNHDGAIDLVINGMDPDSYEVEIRWYENLARPGSGLKFDIDRFEVLPLDLDYQDTPFFTDVNEDGLNDLLLGRSTGRLEYYLNQGSRDAPSFVLEEPAFLGIDDDFITFKRNLVPFVMDIDLDGRDDLLTTDYTGVLTLYPHYQENPDPVYRLLNNPLTEEPDTIMLGYQSWLTGGNLIANEFPILLAGTISGGIQFFRNMTEDPEEMPKELILKLYPNPLETGNPLNILTTTDGSIQLYNSLGQLLDNPVKIVAYRTKKLDIAWLPEGIYYVRFISDSGRSETRRLIRF